MPMDRSKYPPDWPAISRKVREEAGNVCEFCGAVNHQAHPETGSKVVLTVAHLDHNPANCKRDNLKALCQRCHLRYDAKQHAETRRRNRERRKENQDGRTDRRV